MQNFIEIKGSIKDLWADKATKYEVSLKNEASSYKKQTEFEYKWHPFEYSF